MSKQNGLKPANGRHLKLHARASGFNAMTAHRLDQQIKRAFLNTYGAESGLRTLVRLGATEMLRAGASKQAIRRALAGHMESHANLGKPSLLTGESRAAGLSRMMLAWADELCAGADDASLPGPRRRF